MKKLLVVVYGLMCGIGCSSNMISPDDPNAVKIREGEVVYNRLIEGIRLQLFAKEHLIADKTSPVGSILNVRGEISPKALIRSFPIVGPSSVSVRLHNNRFIEFRHLDTISYKELILRLNIMEVELK